MVLAPGLVRLLSEGLIGAGEFAASLTHVAAGRKPQLLTTWASGVLLMILQLAFSRVIEQRKRATTVKAVMPCIT